MPLNVSQRQSSTTSMALQFCIFRIKWWTSFLSTEISKTRLKRWKSCWSARIRVRLHPMSFHLRPFRQSIHLRLWQHQVICKNAFSFYFIDKTSCGASEKTFIRKNSNTEKSTFCSFKFHASKTGNKLFSSKRNRHLQKHQALSWFPLTSIYS